MKEIYDEYIGMVIAYQNERGKLPLSIPSKISYRCERCHTDEFFVNNVFTTPEHMDKEHLQICTDYGMELTCSLCGFIQIELGKTLQMFTDKRFIE